jgi:hypothetical protein
MITQFQLQVMISLLISRVATMDRAFTTFDASEIHCIVESFNKLLDKLHIAGQLTLGPDLETPKFEVLMHLWSAVYDAIHL